MSASQASPTPSVPLPGRRRTRSVWGCLTCRQRKVKCQSREVPCSTCLRLDMLCTPSFASNFKKWKHSEPKISPELAQGQSPPIRTSYHSNGMNASPKPTNARSNTVAAAAPFTLNPEAVDESQTADGSSQFLFDWSLGQWTPYNSTIEAIEGSIDRPPSHGLFNSLEATVQPRTEPPEANEVLSLADYPDRSGNERVSPMNSASSYATSSDVGVRLGHYGVLSQPTPINTVFPSDLNLSYLIQCPMSPALDDERTLVDHYKYHLSSFFSIKSYKSTNWNFYSYAILSTESYSDSPLRHSILAWASAHLILTDQSSSGDTLYRHYARARAATNDLLLEMVEADELDLTQPTSKKLRMFLSTCLFLGFCDILSGDFDALASSLRGIKRLLEDNWERLRQRLGSLESRILIWLSYLDLRTNFWRPTMREAVGHGKAELFSFLMTHMGFSSLRSTCGGNFYLTECFGSLYPEDELKEDLLQEPAKLLSDEAVSLFNRILEYEAWDDEIQTSNSDTTTPGSLIEELRDAKVQAIRAEIARVRAECKVIHAELMGSSTAPNHIVCTERLSLTTTALHLSATILLSRIVSPDIRTDGESQNAAQQIIKIARRLQGLGFHSPRSLIWPLPVFIAGIEVADEIYQDWVLSYMQDQANLGYSTAKARELLRRVIEEQTHTGKRVKVRYIMNEFAGESHILV